MEHICEKCGFKSTTKGNLMKHLNKKYPCDSNKKQAIRESRKTCPYCVKVFASVQALNYHIITGNK